MRLTEAIDKRKSIRSFQEKKIPKSVIRNIIKNATKAPSAGNRQPWIFYCVDSKTKRDEISKLLYNAFKALWKQNNLKTNKIQKVAKNFYQNIGGS